MNKRKGMSLIVLVITILVMIVLAGVVVVGLANNNPIDAASESVFKANSKNFAASLGQRLATEHAIMAITSGKDVNVKSDEIDKYIPSIPEKERNKFEIQDGELAYIGKIEKEQEWASQIDILNGNAPNFDKGNSKSIALGESIVLVKEISGERYVLLSSYTESGNRLYKLRILDKEYKTLKERSITNYEETLTLYDVGELSNGNIVVGGRVGNSTTMKPVVSIFLPDLSTEIKRINVPVGSGGRKGNVRYIISLPNNEFALLIEMYTASGAISSGIYTKYDSNGNVSLDNKDIKVEGKGTTIYGADISPSGKYTAVGGFILTGKGNACIMKIDNTTGEIVNVFKPAKSNSFRDEYRELVYIDESRIFATYIHKTNSEGGYEATINSVHAIDIENNKLIKNNEESMNDGLPGSLNIVKGYNDCAILVEAVRGSSGEPLTKLSKMSYAGETRWIKQYEWAVPILSKKIINKGKNKFIVFGTDLTKPEIKVLETSM